MAGTGGSLLADEQAICEASKSLENNFTICRIWGSEILERFAYLFFNVITRTAQLFYSAVLVLTLKYIHMSG